MRRRPSGRAPGVHPEGLGGEAGLGDEGRDRGRHDDEDAPRGEAPEEGGEGGERHRVLGDPEGLHDERQRARRGLPPGVLHLVVDVGVLEVAQLEGEGLLEDRYVDAVAEVGPEQLAEEPEEPPDDERRRQQGELHEHQRATRSRAPADPVRAASTTPSMMSLPTQATGAGRSAATAGEGRDGERAAPIGLPDQPEGARDLREDADGRRSAGRGGRSGGGVGPEDLEEWAGGKGAG